MSQALCSPKQLTLIVTTASRSLASGGMGVKCTGMSACYYLIGSVMVNVENQHVHFSKVLLWTYSEQPSWLSGWATNFPIGFG